MERSTEDAPRADESLETLSHDGRRIVREGQQDDLGGCGAFMGQQMGDPCSERRRFAGSRGGQDSHTLCRWLTNNTGLFVIQRECSFAEDEAVRHLFM